MRKNPIVVTPLRQVTQIGKKLVAALERFPHELEYASRRVGMAHYVVVLSKDL
jgi:hypothetical protein